LTNPEDPVVDRWRHDITVIAGDVTTLYHARSIFRTVNKFIAENEELPRSIFFGYFYSTYAISQAIAIRRLVGQRKDSVTLEKLLAEIKRDPERLTRERFLAFYDVDDVGQRTAAHHAWDLLYASTVGDHVDPALVETDRKALVAVAAPMVKYATERIAHTSREPMKNRLAFGEIDKAIAAIGPMYAKYARLLNGHATTLERSTRADLVRLFSMPWVRRH
jgi:hypothetical protein